MNHDSKVFRFGNILTALCHMKYQVLFDQKNVREACLFKNLMDNVSMVAGKGFNSPVAD